MIHAAAKKHEKSPAERIKQESVNVDGTRNVIAACLHHRVRRLVVEVWT